jgi:outer membrane protein OmpA-like peptidoglycan-associated protein
MSTKFLTRMSLVLVVSAMSACTTAPKPPTVDGSQRQPVNDASATEMLQFRARFSGAKGGEQADRERIQFLEANQKQAFEIAMQSMPYSVVFHHHFPFGVARLNLSVADKKILAAWTKNAELVEVRGRTDGLRPAPGDEAIARERAVSVRRWLVRQGFAADKVNVNYVSAGDYAADNNTPEGRSQNRRVEVHFFSTKPFL